MRMGVFAISTPDSLITGIKIKGRLSQSYQADPEWKTLLQG